MSPLVEAKDLTRVYRSKRGVFTEPQELRAVGGVSFSLQAGKTLAVVGESGCGKSTLARLITLIEKPNSGSLMLDGADAVNTPAADQKAAAPHRPARLPKSLRLAQSAQEGRLDPGRAADYQHEREQAGAAQAGACHDGARRVERRISRIATRTCSPAASASASPSPAR